MKTQDNIKVEEAAKFSLDRMRIAAIEEEDVESIVHCCKLRTRAFACICVAAGARNELLALVF